MIHQLSTQSSSSGLKREKRPELFTEISEHSQQTLVGGSSGRGNAGQIEPPPDRSQEIRLTL